MHGRREFIASTAKAAAASALAVFAPRVIRDALAQPPARISGSLQDVEHIVILTQENRSFDHYFGSLRGVCGFNDAAAIALPNGAPVWQQPCAIHPDGFVMPFHIDTHGTSGVCAAAPEMSYPTDIGIWNGGRFDAWNTARAPGLGMGYLKRNDIPFYYALTDAFTVCDQYFCSTLTQTNPNRLHLFSGSNGGSVNQPAVLDNEVPAEGFGWSTCAELLDQAGVSWRVYQQPNNFDDNAFAWFGNFRRAGPGNPLFERGMRSVPDLVAAFASDVQAETLPQVSWIVAPDYLSEHAHFSPHDGQDLCARLLAALVANPRVWSKTVFLLNYDEQGGWFDHVPPPMPPAVPGDGLSNVDTVGEIFQGKPIGLGFRVPMLVISPWSRGGWVCSQVFDHTSVLQFIERRFGIHCPNISPWRRAVCGDLTSALDFGSTDCAWPPMPQTSEFSASADLQCRRRPGPEIPSTQQPAQQEPGPRPARALAYAVEVNARLTDGGLELQFFNSGGIGAVFQVYDCLQSDAAPRRYTVAAGSALRDSWKLPAQVRWRYRLRVTGPNGFVREFEG